MSDSNGAQGQDPELLRDEIRRTRAELGETVEALAAKADVKARLRESAEHTKERVSKQAAQARDRLREQAAVAGGLVRERAGQASHAVREAGGDVTESARREPVPWAVVLLGAVGLAVAILVIRGRRGR